MAAPTYVGAGNAVYSGSAAWPSSLTINSSDLPSGTQANDAVVLFVTAFYSQRTFPTPVDDTLASFSGLTGWSVVPRGSFSSTFAAANLYYQVYAYVWRRASIAFPVTITPIGATSGTAYTPINGGNYRAQLLAWRPSRLLGNTNSGTANNASSTIPSSSSTVSVVSAEAVTIAAAALPAGGTIGALSTANGFTERFHQPDITSPARGGSLRVADRSGSGGQTSPQWSKGNVFPDNPSGASVLFVLDAFDPATASDWGVGRIAW